MSGTQSGTIDGISYASSENIYDTLGYGVVTQTLYFDQNGTQVADRFLSTDLGLVSEHYNIGPKTTNSDGTFSFEISPRGSGGGYPQGYSLDSFSSAGISTREDDYTPIYITSASGTFLGTAGYTDSYTLFNAAGPGSAGTINGKYYDMVETKYDSSGVATEKDYMNDLNDTQTMVARQILVSPNPVLTLATAATASAGTAQPLPGIQLTDDWAGLNAGTLALTIGVDAGTVTGYDNTGQPFTVSAGTPKHFTGTLSQIEGVLLGLSYTGQAAGTAHVSLQVYDQAGIRASGQETVTVGAASGSGTTPDPILTGVTQTSVAAGTPLSFNGVSFSDPWAANHAGTLVLTVTTTLGTLSEVNGNATVSNGVVHAVGTVTQIDTDLASLILTSSQTGTANVKIDIYDQAGLEAVHVVGVTVHA